MHPQQEVGVDEQALEGELDTLLEAARGPALVVEVEQHRDVGLRDGPAVRPTRQPRQDLAGARPLVGRGGGPTTEDGPPARGVGDGARHLVGPADLDRADRRVAHVDLVVGEHPAALQRLRQALLLPQLAHERHPHGVGAGLDRHLDEQVVVAGELHERFPLGVLHEPRLARAGVAGRARYAGGVAPDGEASQQPPVEADVEPLRPAHPHEIGLVLAAQPHPDGVLAVDGELVGDREPAPRAERQVLALPAVLDDVQGHLEGVEPRRRRRQPHRQAGDLPGHRQVPLEMGARDGEDVGEVVEAAVGRLVPRQQRGDVDVEGEEVADGVGVLGPVDAVHGAAAPGIGVGGPRRVERPLQVGGHRGVGRGVGPRAPRRGHRRRPQLRDDLLPELGVRLGVRGVGPGEAQLGRAQPVVVARDAVPVEHRPHVGRVHRARVRRPLRRDARGRRQGDETDGPGERRHPATPPATVQTAVTQ